MAKKEKIYLLQVGTEDWSGYHSPSQLQVEHLSPAAISEYVQHRKALLRQYQQDQKKATDEKMFPKSPRIYGGLLLTDTSYPEEIGGLLDLFDVYTIFYNESVLVAPDDLRKRLARKLAYTCDIHEPEELLLQLGRYLFSGQNGAKFPISDLQVTPHFQGKISLQGQSHLALSGEFGGDFQQIAYFRYNLPYDSHKEMALFFEHLVSEGVSTQVRVQLIPEGSLGEIFQEWVFDMADSRQQLRLTSEYSGVLAIAVWAKGTGDLTLGPCHYRDSRGPFGEFVLGGQRFVDSQQQEFMYYFDPQDFQPPLCVYFSGFRTAEGFEGYRMMKDLQAPFLLICDPRLEGGSFYMGSSELEQKITDIIREKLAFLGFDNRQLILSGLSMGTFGAAYYGARLAPHAIVIGKPVLSLGEVALNERLNRPGGFPTSLDILSRYTGQLNEDGAKELDDYFWHSFSAGDFSKTTFAIAYMQQDDYDKSAFEKVLETTRGTGATVIGRGWPGRHTDGGFQPILWFLKQYQIILEKDFGRISS